MRITHSPSIRSDPCHEGGGDLYRAGRRHRCNAQCRNRPSWVRGRISRVSWDIVAIDHCDVIRSDFCAEMAEVDEPTVSSCYRANHPVSHQQRQKNPCRSMAVPLCGLGQRFFLWICARSGAGFRSVAAPESSATQECFGKRCPMMPVRTIGRARDESHFRKLALPHSETRRAWRPLQDLLILRGQSAGAIGPAARTRAAPAMGHHTHGIDPGPARHLPWIF